MSDPRRALFLVYDILPGAPVGSSLRSSEFRRRLPELGWEVDVLCARGGEETGAELERVPPTPSLAFSDQAVAWDWARRLRRNAVSRVARQRPDLIYASCPPFPLALAAAAVARETSLPLVLDFRDSWSEDPHATGGALKRCIKSLLRRSIYTWAERRAFAAAAVVISNTPSMDEVMSRLGLPPERRMLIPNGYSEEAFAEPLPVREPGPLRIVHCGRFFQVAGRRPIALFAAAASLRAQGHPVELHLVGDEDPALILLAAEQGLTEGLFLHPPVPLAESIRWMRTADVVVVYQEPGRGPVTPVAGKTYEALRCGRPILGLVPAGDNARLLRESAGCAEVLLPDQWGQADAALLRLLRSAPRSWPPSATFLRRFERGTLSQQLVVAFERAIKGTSRDGLHQRSRADESS